jgi:hypothetical protein
MLPVSSSYSILSLSPSRSSFVLWLSSRSGIILFIDEIHLVLGAGKAEGAMDAANLLKPMLARGELRCIGATTLKEYREHVEKDPAFERRFQPVSLTERDIHIFSSLPLSPRFFFFFLVIFVDVLVVIIRCRSTCRSRAWRRRCRSCVG